MTLSFVMGTVSAAITSPLAPAKPGGSTGNDTDDAFILIFKSRDQTAVAQANAGAGWTDVGAQSGGTGSFAADSGTSYIRAWVKPSGSTYVNPSIAWTTGTNFVGTSYIVRITGGYTNITDWDRGNDTTLATSWRTDYTPVDIAAGDWLFSDLVFEKDSAVTWSSETLQPSTGSFTYGSIQVLGNQSSNLGNDIGGRTIVRQVLTGSGSALTVQHIATSSITLSGSGVGIVITETAPYVSAIRRWGMIPINPVSQLVGSYPHQLLDLNDWQWQSPLSQTSGGTAYGTLGDGDMFTLPDSDTDTTEIETYKQDMDSLFQLDQESGVWLVRFRSPMEGSTSSASVLETRSEMREMHYPVSTQKASWSAATSTVHNLKIRTKVNHVATGTNGTSKARVVLAQMHCTTVFGVFVYYEGSSDTLRYKFNKTTDETGVVSSTYNLGDWVNIGLSCSNSEVRIYVNDTLTNAIDLTAAGSQTVNTTCYFKWGCYNQENVSDGYSATEYNEIYVAAAKVQHDVAWASGGYEPIGPGV